MPVPALAPASSPVAPAYRRAAEVMPELRLDAEPPAAGTTAGERWVSGAELAAGGPALAAFLATEERRMMADYQRPARPDVVASFALHRYAWPAALLFTLPYFLLRRVPRLAPGDVFLDRAAGRLAARVTAFSCLPDDPAAGQAGAHVVRGESALRAAVRRAAAEHLGPVLAAFGPRMRRGPRALWGVATDELTEGLWYLGQLLGEEERARAEAGLLLPGGTVPYAGGAAFRELTPACGGAALTTRDRASCCLYYTLRPEDTCVTCPRTGDAERLARLTA